MLQDVSFRSQCGDHDSDTQQLFASWVDMCVRPFPHAPTPRYFRVSLHELGSHLSRISDFFCRFRALREIASTTQDYEKMHWDVKINIFQWTPKICEKKDRGSFVNMLHDSSMKGWWAVC